MKTLILLTIGVIASVITMAQTNHRYVVKHGTTIKSTFNFKDIYLLPSFMKGKANFKEGYPGGGLMNYNRLTGEMDFIQLKDTLAFMDKDKLKNIVIGNEVFYFHTPEGFLRRVDAIDKVILAKSEIIKLADMRKPSTIDNFVQTPTTDGTYSSFVYGMPVNMIQKVDLVFVLIIEYYLGNEKGIFKIANKKNLVKFFPEKKAALTNYLEEHTVDFGNFESLQNVFKDIREIK